MTTATVTPSTAMVPVVPSGTGGDDDVDRDEELVAPAPGSMWAGGLPRLSDWGSETREIREEAGILAEALDRDGPAKRREPRRRVRAGYWGPGQFGRALRLAVQTHQVAVRNGRLEASDSPPPQRHRRP